jgi:hypothetical protein
MTFRTLYFSLTHLNNHFSYLFFKVFGLSKIDLMRAYHQIPVHPDDIKKLQLPNLLVFWNSLSCPLACKTPPKHFNASWTRSSKTWTSLPPI